MIRVDLEKIIQRNDEFFVGKADPRILVQLADDIQVGEVQDAQRPLEKKHLEEIAKYVGEESGILPQSVLISTKQENQYHNQIKVETEEVDVTYPDGETKKEKRYFAMIPDTPQELAKYRGTIDIIDGQHRLFSFSDAFRSIEMKDSDEFEMAFCLFVTPSIRERQQLFMVTNEKQKAVNGNLLLWLREKLGLLEDNEKRFYPIVNSLNSEEFSPLKGRIIQSAEKISKGYKAKEMIKILGKTFPENNVIISQSLPTDDKKVSALCKYIKGWEKYYDLSFQRPDKDTMTKISGLRYIMWWFPTFWETAINERKQFDDSYIGSIIEEIQDSLHSDYKIFDISANFRGEGATDKAVKDHINIWKAYHSLNQNTEQPFDPLA